MVKRCRPSKAAAYGGPARARFSSIVVSQSHGNRPLSARQPGVLLVHQAFIQLFEKRRRLVQRLPWRELARLAAPYRAAVVVGQRPAAAGPAEAGFLLILDHLLRAEQPPFTAQILVQLLGSVGRDAGQAPVGPGSGGRSGWR